MTRERSAWRNVVPLAALLLSVLPLSAFGWLDPATDPNVTVALDTADTYFDTTNGPDDQIGWTSKFGASNVVRIKSHQYIAAFKWDLSTHKGKTVQEAELHLAKASADPIFSLVASTINTDWSENSATGSSYRYKGWSPTIEYTFKNSDFTTTTFGNYGTLVSYGYLAHDTFKTYTVGSQVWIAMKLDPALIQSMTLDSYGLSVADPRGHLNIAGNPYIYTKDHSAAVQPKLYIKFATTTDTNPPGAVTNLTAAAGLENRKIVITFNAPTDSEAATAFGYNVKYYPNNNFASAYTLPRWRIPRPKAPGTSQSILLEATNIVPGMTYYVWVQPYDAAGNTGPVVSTSISVPADIATPTLATGLFTTPNPAGKTVKTVPSVLNYWAASEFAKINPATGNRIEDGYTSTGADDYKKANAVWDAGTNTISLQASRNEIVGCQLILQRLGTNLSNVHVVVSDLAAPNGLLIPASPYVELYQLHYVTSGITRYPEVAIPLFSPFPTTFNIPDTNHNPSGVNQSVWMDLYVPKYTGTPSNPTDVEPGDYKATITVTATELASPVTINLKVRVSPVTIPDNCTFLVDYNGYSSGTYDPTQKFFDWDFGTSLSYKNTVLRYFQTLHKHRASPNVLPYGWGGLPSNTDRAPTLFGTGATRHTYDWSLVDRKYNQVFQTNVPLAKYGNMTPEKYDPSLLGFSRLNPASPYYGPGENTPVATFYTPFFEGWPTSITDANYGFDAPAPGKGGAYWNSKIDNDPPYFFTNAPDVYPAFSIGYTTSVTNVFKDWCDHAKANGWTQTNFQCFLNNKYSFTNTNALWILEECETGDDFRATGYFNKLWRDGQAIANTPEIKWHFRIDISDRWGQNWGQLTNRINWQVTASGTANWHWPNKEYRKYFFDADKQEGWAFYGDGTNITDTSTPLAQRLLQHWCQGFDGGVPWYSCFQTSWTTANDLALIYSGNGVPGFGVYEGCLVSIRVKAIRHVQQIIELLNKWAATNANSVNRPRVRDSLASKYADKTGAAVTWGYYFAGADENKIYAMQADLQAQLETLFLTGDINGDGSVDVVDLLRMAATWGSAAGDDNYDSWADFNKDGSVDVVDLLGMAENWGASQPVP